MSDLFEIISEEEFRDSAPANSVKERSSLVEVTGMSELAGVETFSCDYCGHCETPNACAWSRQCPTCGAPAGKISYPTYCRTSTGGITGLHIERWKGGES